jgi:tRNA G18 (ribose-2'-O)-methylase SpoU
VIERIARADDPRIRAYTQVGDHQWLRDQGLFVAEGRLVLRRLLESRRFQVHSVLLTPAALRSFGAAVDTGAPVFVAEQATLQAVTGFNFHRGCVALAHRPAEEPSSGGLTGAALLLALEGVGNPDNVGGLFRVAASFGVDGVILDPTSGDPFYRKAVRTSMAAVLSVPFERLSAWPAGLDGYRRKDVTVVALTPRPGAIPVADAARTLDPPLIIVVGAEGPGLSESALRAADVLVRIPITAAVDSLNVTVAAGVALAYLAPCGG